MKSFIAAMLILVLIIVGTAMYIAMLNHSVERLEAHVTQIENDAADENWQSCQAALNDLFEEWNRLKPQLEFFMHHNEMDQIYQILYEVKGYADFRNREELLVKTGVLRILIEHLPENEQLTLKNIF